MDRSHLEWPFFEASHRALAAGTDRWASEQAAQRSDGSVDARCRAWVAALADGGHLRHCVPAEFGGNNIGPDSRSICVLREVLAYHDGLADFAFAMQGLGSGPIALGGNRLQQDAWLPKVARGEAIAAFALSEPDAGSDVGALTCRARREGEAWLIDGCKTWISNGGIADFYCVFARTGVETGSRGISAFVVPAETPGLVVAERIDVIAPHPLARIELESCRVGADALVGREGEGFKLAMQTLDIFRASVGAAALGFARRALDLAVERARSRRMFGATLADRELTQAKLAEMATLIDASALLVYRAAWQRDIGTTRTTREAAMAKMAATEWAQEVIDASVQMHGGLGVMTGHPVERLYREIRALRIYEGATEVQKLIIGRAVLAAGANT
jgi:acyl-CoA dehydrogenase